MRRAITAVLRLCLRIFYRRIELMGLERIPDSGPVIFAVNHPNGLVDPLFILCLAARRVSFLGKAPLFRYPVIGWFVRLFDTIPVYRKGDGAEGSNKATFARAREVLEGGGAIAIFPEGTTHSDSELRELKTGAARIALGSSLDALVIIPAGIYYTAKDLFRSSALLVFGEPLRVSRVVVDSNGEPPREAVVALTAAIEQSLDAVTLQADSHAALELIAHAEDILTADARQPLVEELDLRRRFVEGYHFLARHDPQTLARLDSMIRQFDSELRRARIEVHALTPEIDLLRIIRLLILAPMGLAGAAVSYPTYRLIGFLAQRFARGEGAVVATTKFIAALALFPLTYVALALLAGHYFGLLYGVLTILLLPLLGYAGLRLFEELDEVIGDFRALAHRLFRGYGHARLLVQREAIRRELLRVAREMAR